jgi:hypothetical protein
MQESARDVVRSLCLNEASLSPRERDLIKNPSANNVGDYLVGQAAEYHTVGLYGDVIKKLQTKKMSAIEVIEYLGIYERAFNVTPLRGKVYKAFQKYENEVERWHQGTHASHVAWRFAELAKQAMKDRKNATMKVSYVVMGADRVLDMTIEFNWKNQRATIKTSSIDPLSKPAKKTELVTDPSNGKRQVV